MERMRKLTILLLIPLFVGCARANLGEQGPTATPAPIDPMKTPWSDLAVQDQAWLESTYEPAIDLSRATEYHMELQIEDDFEVVSGQQQIRYTNNEQDALDAIYLRLFPNLAGGEASISSVTVDRLPVEPIYEAQGSAVRIPIDQNLEPGDSVLLELEFSTSIPRQMEGNYGLFGYFDGFLVLDTFYPMIPAYDEDGWQRKETPPNGDPTYNDISFYLVRVHAPADLTMVATGSEVARSELDGEQIVTYASGPARDFYIAAAADIEKMEARAGETVVRSYAPARFKEHAEFVLRTAVEALESYEDRFGDYPYPEMELISTPMLALGIEYPGVMGISIDLYDPGASIGGTPSRVYLEGTVAHEVAHQWFYNLVGNDQVHHPWLDEALAQYATYLYYQDAHGDQAAASFRQSWYERWDRADRAEIPIGLPAGDYQGAEYSGIVYGRGPIFIDELSESMTPEQFDAFMHDYVNSHAWGIATDQSFQAAAETACGCDLDALFARWVQADD